VQPRKGRRDGYHGYIDTDLFDTGVLVEGKAGAGSFVLSARRSYVDLILPAVIPDEVGLGLTLAPRYWDYQALFDYPLPEPVGGELSLRVFGSDDRSKLLFTEQNEVSPDERNSLENIQWFHRADLVWRKLDGPWEFLVTPSYKREFFSASFFGIAKFDVVSDTFSARSEISRMLSKRARLRLGSEFVGSWYTGEASFAALDGAPSPALGSAAARKTDYVRLVPAVYSTLTVRLGDTLHLFPGVRVTHYSDKAQLARTTVDPRLRFIWQIAARTAFKGGVGLYSQGPGLLQGDGQFGNPRALPERSLHTSLAVAQELPWDLSLEVTGFYKRLWNLLSPSADLLRLPGQEPRAQNFANTGTGHIYGGELLLQKPLGDRFYGWLSYTLMRSVRTPAPGEGQRLFDFDQTH
ncbi:MAG: TonB-dependent receptor, partial [Myxococcales bacterium]|nr:TonB-dependent receptor [Myxococcales bacterium]